MSPCPEFSARDLMLILERSASCWSPLRGKSLFITGGTGFFGRWLIAGLHAANRQYDLGLTVTVLTRDPAARHQLFPSLAGDSAFRFHAGDVRDFDFPAGHFTHVIHAATTSASETFAGESGLAKFDTLVNGTRRVLDFAATQPIEAFLFTSSGVVYHPLPQADGDAPQGIPEHSLLAPDTQDPNSALGQAKRAAEFLCASYAQTHRWRQVSARCFSFVGPGLPLDLHYAIGNFIQQALSAPRLEVHSDGLAVRSYLYTADLVVWLLTLLTDPRASGAINVGSDQPVSIGELAHRVGGLLAPDKPVVIHGRPAAAIGNPVRNVYLPDVAQARSRFQLDIWTSLDDAIRSTARHAENQAAQVCSKQCR